MSRRICVWRGVRSDMAGLFIYTVTVIISRSAAQASPTFAIWISPAAMSDTRHWCGSLFLTSIAHRSDMHPCVHIHSKQRHVVDPRCHTTQTSRARHATHAPVHAHEHAH